VRKSDTFQSFAFLPPRKFYGYFVFCGHGIFCGYLPSYWLLFPHFGLLYQEKSNNNGGVHQQAAVDIRFNHKMGSSPLTKFAALVTKGLFTCTYIGTHW
jgi:hypothetical protein